MNVGTFVSPNTKGQIVIPSALRKALGITEMTLMNVKLVGPGIYLQPVRAVLQAPGDNGAFLELLKKTAGAFAGDPNFSPARLRKQKELELTRTKKLKQTW